MPFFRKHFTIEDETSTMNLTTGNATDYFNENFDRHIFKLTDLETLQKNDEFKVALSEAMFLRNIVISVYRDALTRIKILNEAIDKELKDNF
jgi:hypothetical protein